MPWIHVTAPPLDDAAATTGVAARDWAAQCAADVAALLGLDADAVIVLVTHADAASGPGAVVTVVGRHRGDDAERALSLLLQREVGRWTGVDSDLVGVLRP